MPYLPTDRLIRQPNNAADPDAPLALISQQGNARQITALNHTARERGLTPNMPVADAQGVCPGLQLYDHDTDADTRFLKRLGLWAIGYSPLVMLCPPNGVALNISGCAHLFGGEQAMMRHIHNALTAQNITATLAIADTRGAAKALACFSGKALNLVPSGNAATCAALYPLPLQALFLDQAITDKVRSLGLKNIGDLRRATRGGLTRRFGKIMMDAHDQALGYAAEPFDLLLPPAQFRHMQNCPNHLFTLDDLTQAATHLTPPLAQMIEQAGHGATHLRLSFFRVDGHVFRFEVRLATPSHDPAHMTRLLCDRLKQCEGQVDAGFGFERAVLEAVATAPFRHDQTGLTQNTTAQKNDTSIESPQLAALADRLNARFGDGTMQQFHPRASHWPERSCKISSYDSGVSGEWRGHDKPRPLTLLSPPQAIEAIAELPDGPPVQFRWRHQIFQIIEASGPERIAPEWWLLPDAVRKAGPDVIKRFRSRDYYRLEDRDGHRFWVFRRGLYGPDLAAEVPDTPHWFVHGLFA